MSDVAQLLEDAAIGNHRAAADLLPVVYEELRKLAAIRLAREAPGHTLDATGLVHEAYLRLVGDQQFENRGHFFAAAAEAMRRILVEIARKHKTAKRGANLLCDDLDPDRIAAPVPDDELLALDEALEKLAAKDPQKAELVKLRYFAGLTADEAAAALGISPSTADRHWFYARAWLKRAIEQTK